MMAVNLALESQSSGREDFAGTTTLGCEGVLFQKYKVGQSLHGYTVVAADLGNALVIRRHHYFYDALFELRAID